MARRAIVYANSFINLGDRLENYIPRRQWPFNPRPCRLICKVKDYHCGSIKWSLYSASTQYWEAENQFMLSAVRCCQMRKFYKTTTEVNYLASSVVNKTVKVNFYSWIFFKWKISTYPDSWNMFWRSYQHFIYKIVNNAFHQ